MIRNTAATTVTEAVILPEDATAIAVDRWEDGGTIHARAFNRSGQDEQDGEWGEDLGEYDSDALDAALRRDGFTPGDAIGYDVPEGVGTVTTWTR